ncbi:Wzz/FepE/Etk N-terminal domain-containing protein [Paraglaciecola sp.]|uniref:Wzz/FepE/Etk N-terminal domain-containing protein n=1 Tax=Paraglaciecola sp. TaxID=1920173 RepID=UPI00273FDB3A|nr:Wzz/FepE/Etk N-terminal domain-containing protein [Paraglaciecola sp.]MDP5029779.1 Wzz/FepE/Etk N-terminal domain-containing protein [Paraglaciecola sp.]
MTEQLQQQQLADDEIDLRELVKAIWKGKWIIIATTFVFSVTAVFYALSLPNVYKSEVTLSPVSDDAGLKIPGQLGGLAALAGVNLGGLGGKDKTSLALEIMRSRQFIGRFIEENDLYLPVIAAEGWSRSEDKLIFDPKIYNELNKEWVREVSMPFQAKPSTLETYEKLKKLLSINQDTTSGIVRISIEHYSPNLAKLWVDKFVEAINEDMRSRDLAEAQKSIAYLNSQIAETNIADVRTMLFSLIEEQTKTVMLANVRDEYILKTVDPAVVAEKKIKPKRAIIVILGMFIGFFTSVFIVFFRYFNRKI